MVQVAPMRGKETQMGLLNRTKVQPDAVEEARQAVDAALASFGVAKEALETAVEVYNQRVDDNDALVASLVARNAELNADADRASRVAAKLSELTV